MTQTHTRNDLFAQMGPKTPRPGLHPKTAAQIDGLHVAPDRPLLICDADEVLLIFLQTLERFLVREGYELRLDDYRLTGNIRHGRTGVPVEAAGVTDLITRFFELETPNIPAVEGAARALEEAARDMQVVVLTNLPHAHREARTSALSALGMPYPVLTNSGPKGAAVAALAERAGAAPSIFVDDTPAHLAAAREHAPHVHRLHFVADDRLKRFLGDPEEAHSHATRWDRASEIIRRALDEAHETRDRR
ncbi:MAG: hypothetical protein LPL00_10835 [Alphaproteobacteria bacterium]|nr:hypothetical protein [Alphaproteobacteria bacterium]MDX5370179.1 hypothetical protein [Alphaproteobacteria bacterium]MDX5464741.1 hypothetical protein [Alphaproteobacteria bacterium]